MCSSSHKPIPARRANCFWPDFSCIIWLMLPFALAGAPKPDPNEEFAVELWMTEKGMPQNIVTALIQTREGYIWAATYNGIAQFDGVNFRTFDATRSPGLTNSRVTSLHEDRNGVIWIGHDTYHLTKFSNGSFEPVPLQTGWPGGTVSGIQSDASGDVWVVDNKGGAVRARDRLLLKPLPEMAKDPSLVAQLIRDGEGRLLVSRNGYIAEITPAGFKVLQFQSDEAQPYYIGAAAARQGGLWVLGQGRVRRWAGRQWRDDLGLYPWDSVSLTTIMETSSGLLLVGTLDKGLFIHDAARGWMNFNRSNGLPQDWIRCMTEDGEHNIWVGTSGGLVVLRPRSVVMRNPPDAWEGRPVQAITRTRDGTVWAATEGAGLYRLRDDRWDHFGPASGLANPFVWSVMEDSLGQVWAGTWGGGLFRMEGTNFVRMFDLAERGEPVTALKEFPAGTLWIGTAAGLIRCKDGTLERFSSLGGAAAGDVRALEAGRDGRLWLGTQGQGLGCLQNGQLKTFHTSDGLPGEFILSLLQEPDGRLWVGTLDKGVCLYQDGRFHPVSTRQGLPSDCIGHIEDDGAGHLWFNSQKGLFRADKADVIACAEGRKPSVETLLFGKAEGLTTLAGSSGFTPSGFRAPDGRLWFPTARGIAVLNPKSVRRNAVLPPVLIEELLVDGKPVDLRKAGNAAGTGAGAVKRVEVMPGRRQIEVVFTALSFTSPERVQFKYMLERLDNGWTTGDARRRVTYPFLPPGDYTFHVIACNSDGLWNEVGDSVSLHILPYIWQTWEFKAAGAVTGLALMGGIVFVESRRRHRRKLERIARERELERERARIAQDIHDDLGVSLTRIGMLSESVAEDLNDRARAAASLGQIYSTARDLTRAMDEIVWAVNPRHDTLESLTNYIARFAHDCLSSAHIRCRLDVPLGVPDMAVRSEVRHNLFLAFKEALNNAMKHSGASEVRVSFQFAPDSITLVVADNGSGFDPEASPPPKAGRLVSGYGINGMRSRLEQVGGRVVVQTKQGEGTRMIFIISAGSVPPVTNGGHRAS